MVKAKCPKCENKIPMTAPEIGEGIICPNCKVVLKVIWLLPIELDFWDEMIELTDYKNKSESKKVMIEQIDVPPSQ